MKQPTNPKLSAFEKIWRGLFESPVHLDSAISKLHRNLKGPISLTVPAILLRPSSLAEAMGVGVPSGEPWKLSDPSRAKWKPAQQVAERILADLDSARMDENRGAPSEEDFPPEMIREWKESWGEQATTHLVRELGGPAPLSLRVTRRSSPGELLKQMSSQLPVKARISDFSPVGLRLAGYATVMSGNEWFEKGDFEIQDEGSQIMALFALWPEIFGGLLSAVPGPVQVPAILPELPRDTPAWNVVDACAGAGGKTLALADALQGKGRVYSYDTSEKKLQALRRRTTRAHLNNTQAVVVQEGAEAESIGRFRKRAQCVLVDAPCSGWGVLRRNPDIKWRQDASVLERMPQIQLRLLKLYSELVAPGGRLVYGVCTFRKAETLEVVSRFLSEAPDFESDRGGYLGPGPCDGFYMHAFKRK